MKTNLLKKAFFVILFKQNDSICKLHRQGSDLDRRIFQTFSMVKCKNIFHRKLFYNLQVIYNL
jgi:hypothetical protein